MPLLNILFCDNIDLQCNQLPTSTLKLQNFFHHSFHYDSLLDFVFIL